MQVYTNLLRPYQPAIVYTPLPPRPWDILPSFKTYLHPLPQPHQPRKRCIHFHSLHNPSTATFDPIPPYRPALLPLTPHPRPSQEHTPLHAPALRLGLCISLLLRLLLLLLPPTELHDDILREGVCVQ